MYVRNPKLICNEAGCSTPPTFGRPHMNVVGDWSLEVSLKPSIVPLRRHQLSLVQKNIASTGTSSQMSA